MKVNVKGHIRDLLAFRRLIPQRKKRIARSSTKPLDMDPVNDLARRLHRWLHGLRVLHAR